MTEIEISGVNFLNSALFEGVFVHITGGKSMQRGHLYLTTFLVGGFNPFEKY